MRICYLSHANNYHTKKWANHFAVKGYEIHVLSLDDIDGVSGYCNKVQLHQLRNGGSRDANDVQKLSYLSAVPQCRRLIRFLDPDIVHAHYATSYGLLSAFSCERQYFLSVWGSDVYDFPKKSAIHRAAFKYSLGKCTHILSTSKAMAQEAAKYTSKSFIITPFGVDMEMFKPLSRDCQGRFVIGTVKALESKYGIDTLIKACAIVDTVKPELHLELRIAGKGSQEDELRKLARSLAIEDKIRWLGFIPQEQVAREWAGFDIGVVASESESFGVSAVECQACGTPLIITDVPGLKEACDEGKSALVVKRRSPELLADAILRLAENSGTRMRMGLSGREYVTENYEIEACFAKVEQLYLSLV